MLSMLMKHLNIENMSSTSIINYHALWDRISAFARSIGRVTTRLVLLLFFVMKNKDTPKIDKLLIFSALSYLVFPIDILDVRRLPIIGWCDELASISVAYQKVCKHITPEMETKVDSILDRWFPEYTPYELIAD